MTIAGYDDIAEGYARCWAPVIRPAAEAVLDWLWDGSSPPAGAHLLDVGTGTGALAIAALERWPELHVTGVDPSGGMLDIAERAAAARLPGRTARRYARIVGTADDLPFPPATFDAAVSSFVLQLVASRAAALREVRRVLRPGARFGWVTWLRSEARFEPDRVANEVLDEAGFEPPEPDGPSGDLASPAAASLAMRRAGFRDVRATARDLAHRWDAAGYVAFFTEFDEASLFADLEPAERDRITSRIRERVERLDDAALTLHLPVVYVTGRAR